MEGNKALQLQAAVLCTVSFIHVLHTLHVPPDSDSVKKKHSGYKQQVAWRTAHGHVQWDMLTVDILTHGCVSVVCGRPACVPVSSGGADGKWEAVTMPPGKYGMQEEWEKEGNQGIVMDFLLPTGIFLKFPVSRNDTIKSIKKVRLLESTFHDHYLFVGAFLPLTYDVERHQMLHFVC